MLATCHMGRQTLWHRSSNERARREHHLKNACAYAAILLGGAPSMHCDMGQASAPRISIETTGG